MSQEKLVKLLQDVEKRLRTNGSDNIWSDYVPVITEGNHHTAYLTEQFAEPSLYNKLCYKLVSANEYDKFTIVLNSTGGILDSAFMVADFIKNSQATINCKVVGTVASAATIVALSCDDLVVSNNLAFMIHNYSTGMQGKGHELKAFQKFTDQELNKTFKEFYLGFLSEEEINDVIEGKDIWLNSEEVKERWDKRLKKV